MSIDWSEADAYIARNRIYKDVNIGEYIEGADEKISQLRGNLPDPEVDETMRKWALKLDWKRPWGGNDYMFCPEMYCTAIKRKLEVELGEFFENYPDGVPEKPWFTTFPPADLIPYHDAIFDVDDKPELLDPRPEVKKRNWWDKEAIYQEFAGVNVGDFSAERRVDWYLRQTEKAEEKSEEKSDYVPLDHQDTSWPSSMRDSCGWIPAVENWSAAAGYPTDDEYSLQQYASGNATLDLY